jgi:hypothetical protein
MASYVRPVQQVSTVDQAVLVCNIYITRQVSLSERRRFVIIVDVNFI